MRRQYLFKVFCKPGFEEVYIERHKNVFPELHMAMEKYGIRNYSIFMQGTELYNYLETNNYTETMENLSKDPASQRWNEYMKDIVITDDNGKMRVETINDLVFHRE